MKERFFKQITVINLAGSTLAVTMGVDALDEIIHHEEYEKRRTESFNQWFNSLSKEEQLQHRFIAKKCRDLGYHDMANYGIAGINQLLRASVRQAFHAGRYKDEYHQWRWKQLTQHREESHVKNKR